MHPVLQASGLSMVFGGLRAVNSVDLLVNEGEIVALIGPNGAGKTTFFNCITGIYNPTEGEIKLYRPESHGGKDDNGTVLNGSRPSKITKLGMARTFQNIRLFPNMTVLENVMIGMHCRTSAGILGALFRPPAVRAEEKQVIEKSYAYLEAVGLQHLYSERARNLPYGDQRRLEIARALAAAPFMLLLDEPAAGMNPHETVALQELIRRLRADYNLSVLLIEHDMGLVMSLSDRIYVMEYGTKIAEGTPMEIGHNPRVIKAYLGEDFNA